MGDPKRIRKNYANPRMLWNEQLLAQDKKVLSDFKPKNKKEIWKMSAFLQNIKDQAKSINSRLGTARREQAIIEQEQLVNRVKRFGLIKKEEVTLGDMLTLELNDVMERRLQTLVVRKDLARTLRQARQFIVHGHVKVGDKKVTSPSYMVPVEEENSIDFVEKSPMKNPSHPERGDVDPKIVIKESRSKKSSEEDVAEKTDESDGSDEESSSSENASDEKSAGADSKATSEKKEE